MKSKLRKLLCDLSLDLTSTAISVVSNWFIYHTNVHEIPSLMIGGESHGEWY